MTAATGVRGISAKIGMGNLSFRQGFACLISGSRIGGNPLAELKHSLEQATLILYNPVAQMRATLRQAMLSLGFRNILDFGTLDNTRTAIIERGPDLVMLDLDRDREGVCKLVREVRHSHICSDPFVVIVALSWHPSLEAVNNSMESGVDDILTMPLSMKTISIRINELIHNRKNFVVTHTYVGPDRRSPERVASEASEIGTIQVPNNLRYKATGDEAAAASGEAVSMIQAKINNHRLNRHAQRITWLIDELLKLHGGGTDLALAGEQYLVEISQQVEDLALDLELQGYGNLLDICDSMENVLTGIRKTPTKQLYELLRVHALAVTATLLEREGAAELVIAALNKATAKVNRAKSA